MRDGSRRVAIIARDDAAGRGLMDAVQKNLIAAGLPADAVATSPRTPKSRTSPASVPR